MLIEKVKRSLEKLTLSRDERLVVGVSGGPDSLALAEALYQLGVPQVIAHVDHGLRAESGEDAAAAKEFAAQRGLDFYLSEVNINDLAGRENISIEEAARIGRYKSLFALAHKLDSGVVAVAHTADDQVETVLMHLFRGSGLSGLGGMKVVSRNFEWDENILIFRPMLEIWREEVVAFCEENKLTPQFDQTNLDTAIYRNRFRHDLIPLLETYNPKLKERLIRMADVLRHDEALIDAQVEMVWRDFVQDRAEEYLQLPIDELMAVDLGLQRRLFRQSVLALRPSLRDISFDAIQRAIDFIETPSRSGIMDWVDGLFLYIEGGSLWVMEANAALPSQGVPQVSGSMTFSVPSQINIDEGWALSVSVEQRLSAENQAIFSNADPFLAYVDKAAATGPLTVRTVQPGDRFAPLGVAEGSMKVADFFINEKLPARFRAGWPLICSGDEVIWIPGFRISHLVRVTQNTKEVVQMSLKYRI